MVLLFCVDYRMLCLFFLKIVLLRTTLLFLCIYVLVSGLGAALRWPLKRSCPTGHGPGGILYQFFSVGRHKQMRRCSV